MSDPAEIERLRSLRLDPVTASIQRKMIRTLVWSSVALVVVGQGLAWSRGESTPEPFDAFAMLRVPPSGHGLMLLGVLVGLATPLARASLLAGWFARRGERAMVALSVLLVAIVLSGLLVRHHAAPPLSERSPPPEAREARSP